MRTPAWFTFVCLRFVWKNSCSNHNNIALCLYKLNICLQEVTNSKPHKQKLLFPICASLCFRTPGLQESCAEWMAMCSRSHGKTCALLLSLSLQNLVFRWWVLGRHGRRVWTWVLFHISCMTLYECLYSDDPLSSSQVRTAAFMLCQGLNRVKCDIQGINNSLCILCSFLQHSPVSCLHLPQIPRGEDAPVLRTEG